MTLAILAAAVILWFALSFVTKTWTRHLVAAVIAGITSAYFSYGRMLDVAAAQQIEPMPAVQLALYAVAGMVLIAAAGMGLRVLLLKSRR